MASINPNQSQHIPPQNSEQKDTTPASFGVFVSSIPNSHNLAIAPLNSTQIVQYVTPALEELRHKVEAFRQQLMNPRGHVALDEMEAEIKTTTNQLLSNTFNDHELDRYGNKHKYLIIASRCATTLAVPVEVPLPAGLASDTAQAFLKQQAPQLFDHWNQLSDLYTIYKKQPENAQPFLETPRAAEILKFIHAEILKAFNEAAIEDSLFQFPDTISALIQSCSEKGSYIAVRSSGADEDTTYSANAGKNESVDYVPPTREAVCKAIGIVVSSYFSYGSLQNRINHGINPFKEPLETGLTSQEQIGEKVGGEENSEKIPISLVLFSNELLYVGGEPFRIMRISATYGHGRGVVGGAEAVSADTYLVIQSERHPDKLYILRDIQVKRERLAPMQTDKGIELQKIQNPPELILKPTLDDQTIGRLFHWGVISETYIGNQPADIEIVIQQGTIYHLQARSSNRPKLLPTYLDLRKVDKLVVQQRSPIKSSIRGEVIVPGKASVVICSQPTDILMANNLEEAERKYHSQMHKIVMVHAPEQANTHPVVNFSELGVPCIYVADREKLKNQIETIGEDTHCVICMQNGTINFWDLSVGAAEACISSGFTVHPAKIAISLPNVALAKPPHKTTQIPQEVKNLLLDIRSATTHSVALERLQVLQSDSWITDLAETSERLKSSTTHMSPVPSLVTGYLSVMDQLANRVNEAFKELRAILELEYTHQRPGGDRLRLLFHTKILETLITGPTSLSGNGVANYSIAHVPAIEETITDIIAYQAKLEHPAHLVDLLTVYKEVFTSKQNTWTQFLLCLEPLIESHQISMNDVTQFKQLVASLRDMGALAAWMILIAMPAVFTPSSRISVSRKKLIQEVNTAAMPTIQAHSDWQGVFDSLLAETNHTQMIDDLQGYNRSLQELHEQLHLFENPATFDAAWRRLHTLTTALSGTNLLSLTKSESYQSSKLIKIMLYKTMENFVDLYDLAIKRMLVSQHFSEQEKLSKFALMLTEDNTTTGDWARHIAPPRLVPNKMGISLYDYLGAVTSVLQARCNNPNEDDLLTSPEVSVSGGAMGTKTDFSRHQPRRMGDVFTLNHQNKLYLLSILNNQLIDDSIIHQSNLPSSFIDAFFSIKMQTQIESYNIEMVSFNVKSDGGVIVRYNVPLRSHSGTLQLLYNKSLDTVSMKGAFLGADGGRWLDTQAFLEALDDVGTLCLLEPIRLNEQEISFLWDLPNSNSAEIAIKEYCALATFSSEGGTTGAAGLVIDFKQRCVARGVRKKLNEYILKKPNRIFHSLYNDYIDRCLPLSQPQPLPLFALIYSTHTYPAFLAFITEWAKNPSMSCKDFMEQCRAQGHLKSYDEPFIKRFLPGDQENGHELITSTIYLKNKKCRHAHELNDIRSTIENYIKNSDNIALLLRLIKEEYNNQESDYLKWTNLLIVLIEHGKGIKTAESIIKKSQWNNLATQKLLKAILKYDRKLGIEIYFQQYRLHKKMGHETHSLMSSLASMGAYLEELAEDLTKELEATFIISSQDTRLSTSQMHALTTLVGQGVMQDQALSYCQKLNLQDPKDFQHATPLLSALDDTGRKSDVEKLCQDLTQIDPLQQMPKDFVEFLRLLLHTDQGEEIQNKVKCNKIQILISREYREALTMEMAMKATLSQHPTLSRRGIQFFGKNFQNSQRVGDFKNLILELMKAGADGHPIKMDPYEVMVSVMTYIHSNEFVIKVIQALVDTPYNHPCKNNDKLYFGLLRLLIRTCYISAQNAKRDYDHIFLAGFITAYKRLKSLPSNKWEEETDINAFKELCELAIERGLETDFIEFYILELLKISPDKYAATSLLRKLFKKDNKHLEIALKAANILGLINEIQEDSNSSSAMFELLKILIKQKQGFDLAIKYLTQVLLHENYSKEVSSLLPTLLDHNRGHDLAINFLNHIAPHYSDEQNDLIAAMIRNRVPLSQDLSKYIRENPSIEFGRAFVAIGESIDVAIEVARNNRPNQLGSSTDVKVLTLVRDLAQKGYALEMCLSFAQQYVSHYFENSRLASLEIFEALAAICVISSQETAERKGVDVKDCDGGIALAIAEKQSLTDAPLQPAGPSDEIMKVAALANQGHYIAVAKAAAQKCLVDKNELVKQKAEQLLKALS